jgi:hypothetical protein
MELELLLREGELKERLGALELLLREGVLMERLGALELLEDERLGVKVLRGAELELLPKWRLDELELPVLGRVTVVRVLL